MPQKPPSRLLNSIQFRDVRELPAVLKEVQFIDVTITSPPYYNLKDYKAEGQIGRDVTFHQYLDDLQEIFGEIHARTREAGSLWVITDSFKAAGEMVDLPSRVAQAARDAGWFLQDILIWNKGKTLPWSHNRFRNLFEFVHVFSKTRKGFKIYPHRVAEPHGVHARYLHGWPERYSFVGRNPSDIWKYSIPVQGTWNPDRDFIQSIGNHVHHCPFPQDLVARIIELASDKRDIVFDPFAGTGAVLAQADCMKRKYLGFEINKEFRAVQGWTFRQFRKQWDERKKAGDKRSRDLTFEGNLILRLRQLKHARVLAQQTVVSLLAGKAKDTVGNLRAVFSLGRSSLDTILRTAQESGDTNSVRNRVEYYFVFDQLRDRHKTSAVIRTHLGEKPLTKYGIDASVQVVSLKELKGVKIRMPKTVYGYESCSYLSGAKELKSSRLFEPIQNASKVKDIRRLPLLITNIETVARRYSELSRASTRAWLQEYQKNLDACRGDDIRAAEMAGILPSQVVRSNGKHRGHEVTVNELQKSRG